MSVSDKVFYIVFLLILYSGKKIKDLDKKL